MTRWNKMSLRFAIARTGKAQIAYSHSVFDLCQKSISIRISSSQSQINYSSGSGQRIVWRDKRKSKAILCVTSLSIKQINCGSSLKPRKWWLCLGDQFVTPLCRKKQCLWHVNLIMKQLTHRLPIPKLLVFCLGIVVVWCRRGGGVSDKSCIMLFYMTCRL